MIWKKFGSPYKPLLLVLKSVFRFHFRAPKVPVLFPSKLPRMCIFGNFGGSTTLSDFFVPAPVSHQSLRISSTESMQLRTMKSHTVLCNSIQIRAISQLHRAMPSFRRHSFTPFYHFHVFQLSSPGLTRSHHVSAPADLLFPISTFLGNFYKIIFIVSTNTL